MAALSFENWLKSGAEGAASADAAAAACTSKNVAKYTIDVKSACKRVDAADAAENASAGGGMEYALQYEVSYSCRARGSPSKSSSSSSSSSLAAKKSNASAPSSALAAAAAAPAAAPLSGPVKVEATLRTLVSQPPLKESADGSLVRPKPLAKETWFVEVRRESFFFSSFFFLPFPLLSHTREKGSFFSLESLSLLDEYKTKSK